MNSPAHDVIAFLSDAGVGQFPHVDADWSLSFNGEPPTPDRAITVYDAGGAEPDMNEVEMFRPHLQVRVRAHDAAECFAKHEEIRLLLCSSSLVLSTGFVVLIWPINDMLHLGKDEQSRHITVMSYRTRRVGLVEEDYAQPEDWSDLGDAVEIIPPA